MTGSKRRPNDHASRVAFDTTLCGRAAARDFPAHGMSTYVDVSEVVYGDQIECA